MTKKMAAMQCLNPSNRVFKDLKPFSGCQRTSLSSLKEGPIRSRAETFLDTVDWLELLDEAVRMRGGIPCALYECKAFGTHHLSRIIEFDDGVRWVARLQLPPLPGSDETEESLENMMRSEFFTICLAQKKSVIQFPIPELQGYEPRRDNPVEAPYFFTKYVVGNVVRDVGVDVPPEYREGFLKELAKIHVSV